MDKLSSSSVVSVIIPTYNRCDYVLQAIKSVLAQTYINYEVIVVDDGSIDQTKEQICELESDKVRYYWQENQGESVARNKGISLARGEYLAFLDSDDLWFPRKLELQVKHAQTNNNYALVYSSAWLIDERGKRISGRLYGVNAEPENITLERLLISPVVYGVCSNILARRKVVEQIGGFDTNIQYGEDWDLLLRLGNVGEFVFINTPLLACRIHDGNQTSLPTEKKISRVLVDHVNVVEKIFNRAESSRRLLDVKNHALAVQYERAGYSYFAVGNWRLGSRQFDQVVSLWPQLFSPERLFNMFTSFCFDAARQNSLSFENMNKVFFTFINNWPVSIPLPEDIQRQVMWRLTLRACNYWYQGKEYKKFIQALIRLMTLDPKSALYLVKKAFSRG